MNKLYVIIGLFAFFCTSNLLAQDGVSWGHTISFEFKNMEPGSNDTGDTLISVEFFVNQKSISATCKMGALKNENSGQYTMGYSCTSIGGGKQCLAN